jgi:hypothetical protein
VGHFFLVHHFSFFPLTIYPKVSYWQIIKAFSPRLNIIKSLSIILDTFHPPRSRSRNDFFDYIIIEILLQQLFIKGFLHLSDLGHDLNNNKLGLEPTKIDYSNLNTHSIDLTIFKIQAMKLDVEFKDDKIGSLSRVLDDLDNSGANEGEVKHLKKQKQDLDIRLRDQVKNGHYLACINCPPRQLRCKLFRKKS